MKRSIYALLFVALLGLSLLPSAAWAGSVTIQVAYADNLRPNPDFPTNMCSGTEAGGATFGGFDGSSSAGTCSTMSFDAGAIRIINNSGQAMDVSNVVVQIGGFTFTLWNGSGDFSIANGSYEDLSQTGSYNFDTSDFGNTFAPGNGVIPTVTITYAIGGGAFQTITYTDSGQVLNTGGFDEVQGDGGVCINNPKDTPGNCNESLQWRDIGTTGFTNPGGSAPEPGTIVLLLTGVAGLVGFARRYAV